MKYLIVDGLTQQSTHRDLLNQMYAMRAQVFKGRLHWNVQVNDYGHERDQFDDRAVYLLVVDGTILKASMRMLPSTGPSLHDVLFSNTAAPMSPEIWEASRICFSPTIQNERLTVQITMALALGKFAKAANMSSLIAHVDNGVLRYMRVVNFDIDVLETNEYANLIMVSTASDALAHVARNWSKKWLLPTS
jgi:N-acyl-L-homoserine lactone synthetase